MNTIKSRILTLSKSDLVNGLIMAVLGAVLTAVEQAVVTGGVSAINWRTVGSLALSTGLSYLVKKFFTNSNGEVLGIKASAQ